MAISEEKRKLLLEEETLLREEESILSQTGRARGERTVVGNIFERPRAAIRAGIRGLAPGGETPVEAYKRGAITPEEVPTFQETALKKYWGEEKPSLAKTAGGFGVSAAGLAADIVTDPTAVLLALVGKVPIGKGTTLGGKVATSKFGQTIGKVAKTEIAPIKATKRAFSRFNSDFINQQVYPKMEALFNEKVSLFGKGVQSFAKRKLKMPDNVINHISKKTPTQIRKSRLALKDSLDDVAIKIKEGFSEKLQTTRNTYNEAFNNLSDTDLINVDDAFGVMKRILIKHRMIDNTGKITTLGESGATNKPFRTLIAFHEQFKPAPGTKGVGGINKHVWQDLKNAIGDASIKDPRLTGEFTAISDALHNQAEKSGLTGIKEARKLFKTYMENVSASKNLQNDSQLSNVFKNPQRAKELSQVDMYLRSNYSEPVKDIIAGRQLQIIDNIGIPSASQPQTMLHQQLEKAVSPRSRKFIKATFFEDLLGKDYRINKVFKEIASFSRNQVIKKTGVGVGSTYILYELLKKAVGKRMYGDEGNISS